MHGLSHLYLRQGVRSRLSLFTCRTALGRPGREVQFLPGEGAGESHWGVTGWLPPLSFSYRLRAESCVFPAKAQAY
jgi:hypothetical protein